MSIMIEPMHPLPAYELDSVNDDRLDALILKLGLKAHVQNSYDPCCVICRQNLMLKNHTQVLRHQFTPQPMTNNYGLYHQGGPNR